MDQAGVDVLPYRTDAEGLLQWVEAVARAGGAERARSRDTSAKQWDGQVMTASALGFYDRDGDRLTRAGEELALASGEDRRALLERSMRAYEPYAALLAEVGAGRGATDAQWIETWWATRGYGSSPSNRAEGAATLGRLVEHVGLGRYVPGRRGHPTRIQWSAAAEAVPGGGSTRTAAREPARPAPPAQPADPAPPAPRPAAPVKEQQRATNDYNDVVVALSAGRSARLVVPHRLPPEERRRLLTLLEALVAEENPRGD